MAAGPVVLLTGGTGLLGANLVPALLRQGWQVRVLTRSRQHVERLRPHLPADVRDQGVAIIEGDIRSATARQKAVRGIDYLIHACHAHEYWRPNAEMYDVNVAAGVSLLREAVSSNPRCKTIFTS